MTSRQQTTQREGFSLRIFHLHTGWKFNDFAMRTTNILDGSVEPLRVYQK
jgi:hypothetical protein